MYETIGNIIYALITRKKLSLNRRRPKFKSNFLSRQKFSEGPLEISTILFDKETSFSRGNSENFLTDEKSTFKVNSLIRYTE